MSLLERVQTRWHFLKHRDEIIQKLTESSIPQEIYFKLAAEYVFPTPGDILVWGIDQAFWENEDIVKALKNRKDDQGKIVALIELYDTFPDCLEDSPLVEFHIVETNKHPKEGFMIFGGKYGLYWDARRSTFHPVEKGRVVYRTNTMDKASIERWESLFDKNLRRAILLEEARQKRQELNGIQAKLRNEKQ